jgi:alginate O-acetyltransferase complex protein AlgI
MIFNELSYFALFLAPSVLLFHLSSKTVRPWILASFGIAFFAWYAFIHFGGAWGSACVAIFVWELIVSRFYRPRSWVCIAGIVQALGILFVFKYAGFFSQAWQDTFSTRDQLIPWRLFLPLGISFFTFEFIHYAADSYAGKIRETSLREYAAFIFFFPSMVAGPIKRFQQFREELAGARFDGTVFSRGVTRILAGLAKKHVLADSFALLFAPLEGDLSAIGRGQAALGLLGYGMRIYLDFSAYSDIAIGSGMLFGIVLPENFNWPYCSRNIGEFWQRWHISLSQWIRDYVYIPLGGSRRGERRTDLNLLLAFGASGLWHGAGYNFLVWGLWHGVMSIIHRGWRAFGVRHGLRMPALLAQAITLVGVMLGWALFSMDLRRSVSVLGIVFFGGTNR